MEASSNQLEKASSVATGARALLRVTLAPPLATHLLTPDFADFGRLHAEIEREVLSSEEPVNLTTR
jgi:DNA-binding transcriptional LysR family regulator